MSLPLAGILYLFGACVVFYFYDRLRRSFKETQNRFTLYFKNMGLYGGICILIYGLMSIFFTHNSFALGIGNIVGETAILICFVYGVAFFFYLVFPNLPSREIFIIGGVLVFISFISRCYFFPYPTVTKSGILRFNTPVVPAITYIAWAVVGMVPLAVGFFVKAIQKPEIRIRSLLLGFFLLNIVATSAIHASVKSPLIYTVAFLGQIAGFSLLFITVLYRPKQISNQQLKQNLKK